MRKYNRVVGTFIRKAIKLGKIAAKNEEKIEKLLTKAAAKKARIDAKLAVLQSKGEDLKAEVTACYSTAKKLEGLFDIKGE